MRRRRREKRRKEDEERARAPRAARIVFYVTRIKNMCAPLDTALLSGYVRIEFPRSNSHALRRSLRHARILLRAGFHFHSTFAVIDYTIVTFPTVSVSIDRGL